MIAMTRLLVLLPIVFALGCGAPPDSAERLGRQGLLGYHVRAGAASEVPDGDEGFVVTANGLGGYRLAWVAFAGSASVFTATITSDSTFDPASVLGYSGREQIALSADQAEIDVQSVPDGTPDGVDFVPLVDPIYVDLRIDGAPANIYFTGADSSRLRVSRYNPAAFTSP
jgi:hypothetical protein